MKKNKTSLAKLLFQDVAHAQVFRDQRDQTHVVIDDQGHTLHLPLQGRAFRSFLCRRVLALTGDVPSDAPLAAVVRMLEAQAQTAPRVTLWNRVARDPEGALWLDLADDAGQAVRVTAQGFTVQRAPLLFHRYSHQRPLPVPAGPGDLRRLCRYLNLAEERDQMLFLCSLVVALVPHIPQPLLILHGPQGAAKTTAARLRRALIDPSEVPTVLVRRDLQELLQALDHHYMAVLDNLTKLAPWQVEVLCQVATGAAFTKRALFTNSEDVIAAFHRPLILTGIHLPAVSPDLLDRAILIALERIPPERRTAEAPLWQAFEAERPQLLHALLGALCRAMALEPRLEFSGLTRMADFTRWGTAAALALGYEGEAFLAALAHNGERQGRGVLEQDPLALALCALARSEGLVVGSASQLLALLLRGPGRGRGLPRQPAELNRRLQALQAPLQELGIVLRSSPGTPTRPERTWVLAEPGAAGPDPR